ncbi:MAG: glycosyltransferase family 2 protein [Ignavibacteria bacterium]|nr:glycosyltransferase family 2 protein [Ignavibacteria bacterium]
MNNNFNPLVSVIIPAYNSEKFIGQAIESVQKQTYSNLEVIVIDDGSTDNTISVVRSISEQDDRINCYKIEPSHRPSVPRNYGIDKAKGKFIAFLDSDDLWSR